MGSLVTDNALGHGLSDVLAAVRQSKPQDESERSILGHFYWGVTVRRLIALRKYDSAWHHIMLATLGEDAFTGDDRICRGHVEGQPTHLTCDITRTMELVHLLYHALIKADLLSENMMTYLHMRLNGVSDWGDLVQSGARVANLLSEESGDEFQFAVLQTLAIAGWATNYRRFASAA